MTSAVIELRWLPVGAGTRATDRVVAVSSRVYERAVAVREHRRPCSLLHAALTVDVGQHRLIIEMAPVWVDSHPHRGVIATGPVGDRRLGWWSVFRYEVRCWRDGRLADEEYAVDGPVALSSDPEVALRLVAALKEVPRLTWGRDEIGCGDMWNSNSVVAWLLVVSGCRPTGDVGPPPGGRAPGWAAGLYAAWTRVGACGSSLSGRVQRPAAVGQFGPGAADGDGVMVVP